MLIDLNASDDVDQGIRKDGNKDSDERIDHQVFCLLGLRFGSIRGHVHNPPDRQ